MKRSVQSRFTLIELLVVVAIIAVLVAMLMPALASARKKVKEVMCMTNMKEIGMAFRLYIEDHDNYMLNAIPYRTGPGESGAPYSRWDWDWGFASGTGHKTWADYMIDVNYFPEELVDCPDYTNGPGSTMVNWGAQPNTKPIIPFAMNRKVYQKLPEVYPFTRIRYPDEAIWMLDGFGSAHSGADGGGGNYGTGVTRHQGGKGVNILFYDSHVELYNIYDNWLFSHTMWCAHHGINSLCGSCAPGSCWNYGWECEKWAPYDANNRGPCPP